jgi:hypothetical protein
MRRWIATAGMAALCIASLRADVTIKQTMTFEGAMAAAAQEAAPKMVMRIKGTKIRTDFEANGQTTVIIVDVTTRQTTLLDAATKTAHVISPEAAAAAMPAALPKMDVSFKATGQSRTIEGAQCEEQTFTVKMELAELGLGGQMPPEVLAMMKDVHMIVNGSVWVAKSGPGTADYLALQKAAIAANMGSVLTGMGQQKGGLDKLLAAATSAPGLPYLSEITTSVGGTSPMVAAMQQMASMKMTQKVTSVSTDAIADDMFAVPADYKIEKK